MAKKIDKKKEAIIEMVKASRKGSREAEIENGYTGFVAGRKVQPSKKAYKRKAKHKSDLRF